jgi:hypothetical protein
MLVQLFNSCLVHNVSSIKLLDVKRREKTIHIHTLYISVLGHKNINVMNNFTTKGHNTVINCMKHNRVNTFLGTFKNPKFPVYLVGGGKC